MTSEDMKGNPLPTPKGQEALEDQVLSLLVDQARETPYGAAFRKRVASRRDVRRQLSGAGFFLKFEVDNEHDLPSQKESPLPLDVYVRSPDSDLIGGFIYFWSRLPDRPDLLEGFTYHGDWPDDVSHLIISREFEEVVAP